MQASFEVLPASSEVARETQAGLLLACRELDGVLGLTEALINLRDPRGGRNVQHQVVPMLRQSIYSRRAGYEDTDNAERLALLNAIEN